MDAGIYVSDVFVYLKLLAMKTSVGSTGNFEQGGIGGQRRAGYPDFNSLRKLVNPHCAHLPPFRRHTSRRTADGIAAGRG